MRSRAILWALLLAVLVLIWQTATQILWPNFTVVGLALSPVPMCVLFLFTIANGWLRRRSPRFAFSRAELILIYVTVAFAGTLGAYDFLFYLPGVLTYGFWHPDAGLRAAGVLKEYLPGWLTVQEPEALRGFYEGNSSLLLHLKAWLTPLAWWTGFGVALCLVLLCIALLLQRRWEKEEKLAYPLTIPPLELTQTERPLWEELSFQAGFVLASGVVLLNSLGQILPQLPTIPLGVDFTPLLPYHPPWTGIRYLNLSWHPFLLGICFLMPLDLTLSLWVFNLFWKAQCMIAVQYGWTNSVAYEAPYVNEQGMGGVVGLALVVLWLDRRYLARVLRNALSQEDGTRGEGKTLRWALVGGATGLGFLVYFCYRVGFSGWIAVTFLALFFLISLAVARMRAQFAPPSHELFQAGPDVLLVRLLGTGIVPARHLSLFTLFSWFTRVQRANPLPMQLESLCLANRSELGLRRVTPLLALLPVVVIPVYLLAFLHIAYRHGIDSAKIHPWVIYHAIECHRRLDGWLSQPPGTNASASIAIGVGLATMLLLYWMKFAFPPFPLHPVAYPVASAIAIDHVLAAVFLVWLMKALLFRYGGLRLYRKALPFFLGLIVGEALLVGLICSPAVSPWG